MIWLNLKPFIDSNLFLAIATYLAGYIVFRVYKSQKLDEKKNAANIIVLEIERAENKLKEITVNKSVPGTEGKADIILMPIMSWDSYKHLFISDFTNFRAEWEKITDFYSLCTQYDNAIVANSKVLDDNTIQLTVNYQRILADQAAKYAKKTIYNHKPRGSRKRRKALY